MRHLFHTRAEVLRLVQDRPLGVPQMTWQKVPSVVDRWLGVPGELKCRIDLSYMRPGKDQLMPVVEGRAPDRIGVLFCAVTDSLLSGDRIRCIDGPIRGTFEIRAMPDVAADFGSAHHLEVQIVEVSQQMKPNLLNRTRESTP